MSELTKFLLVIFGGIFAFPVFMFLFMKWTMFLGGIILG